MVKDSLGHVVLPETKERREGRKKNENDKTPTTTTVSPRQSYSIRTAASSQKFSWQHSHNNRNTCNLHVRKRDNNSCCEWTMSAGHSNFWFSLIFSTLSYQQRVLNETRSLLSTNTTQHRDIVTRRQAKTGDQFNVYKYTYICVCSLLDIARPCVCVCSVLVRFSCVSFWLLYSSYIHLILVSIRFSIRLGLLLNVLQLQQQQWLW